MARRTLGTTGWEVSRIAFGGMAIPGVSAMRGIRAMVSHDLGKTWEPEMYVIGQNDCYPTGIAMPDGSLITTCTNMTAAYTLEFVRWRPLVKQKQSKAE